MTYHQSCRTTAAGLLLPLLALFLVIGPIEAFATTWNVSPSSSGTCTTADPNCNTIQGAITGATTGDTIKVFPGIYGETAPIPPSYGSGTVGLYIPTNSLTIQGVDSGGAPITDPGAVEATVNTISNLDFGPDGFFVTGDSVTIAGIRVGTNTGGQNKTIEIIGDDFTLKDCDIADLQGSVYINDFTCTAPTATISHVQSYTIQGNIFEDGVSLDIANGAGLSGGVGGRTVTGNTFKNLATTVGAEYWPSVSLTGSDTGIPWFVCSVGGAVITGNTFSNSAPDGQLIRARGTYDNTQFNWASYWNGNTFNKAAVVGALPPADVRTYSYPNDYGTFNNVRRIGGIIQGEVDNAQANDTVLVAAGTYAEQVTIDKSVSLHGAGAGSSIIKAPAVLAGDADGSLNVVTITGAGVNAELSGVTVSGPGPSGCGSINRGIFVRDGANANIHNNAISDIRDEPLSGCQNGQGIFVGRQAFSTTGTATITSNVITGYQKGGIVVDNTGSIATITGNTVSGVGATPSIAQNGIQVSRGAVASLSGNTVNGNLCNYTSCGPDLLANDQSVGILLYQAGNGTSISANPSVSNNDVGIYNIGTGTIIHGNQVTNNRYEGIFLDEGSATVDMNVVQGGNIGVAAVSFSGASADSSGTLSCNRITGAGIGIKLIDDDIDDAFIPTVTVNTSAIDGNTTGVVNSTSTTMAATGNWWGCVGGPGSVGCDTVVGDVNFAPVATSVPPCVFCSVKADCDDGLTCNGAETCVAHSCKPGTPVNCNDSCNTGTCDEPGGTCTLTPKTDGISCNIGDVCQAGVCAGTNSLTLGSVTLRKTSKSTAKNGSLVVKGLVNDTDTGGTLVTNLQGGTVVLDVIDGGLFHSTITFQNCNVNSRSGNASCNDKTTNTVATFRRQLYGYGGNYNTVYVMSVRQTRLGSAVAGVNQPSGPVQVTLSQEDPQKPVQRTARLDTCRPSGKSALVCRSLP